VDPAFRTLTGSLSDDFDLETIMNAATYLATWFREEFGDPALGGRPDPGLDSAAAAVPIGADGLLTLPYWNAAQTPYWDPLARGAVIGWHGRHTRAHLYRSLLEGVGYELRLHIAGLEAATGRRIETLRAMGGGTRSELWLRVLADVTQRPIQVCNDAEISAKGAAVLAFSYLDGGGDATIRMVAKSMVSYDQHVDPDPSTALTYTRYFEIYRELYPQLRSTFAALATVEK
jgi:xylulokinase